MAGKYGLDAEIAAKIAAKYDKGEEEKVSQWLASVTGARLSGDLWASLKSGVVLCKLANVILPGSVERYNPNPKHYLEEKANIDAYLTACVKMGVPSADLFTQLDLSETRKDMLQVVQNLFAVARQAQALGFRGPTLGVTYYKTREEQIELEQKKMVEKEKERIAAAEYDNMLLENRIAAESAKKERNTKRYNSKKVRREMRLKSREERGRSLKIAPGAYEFKTEERSVSPVKFGMDAEHENRMADNYNADLEDRLMDWIEAVTGYAIDSFHANLKSGQVLCDMVNAIRPGTIGKVHRVSKPLMERENIQKFLQAAAGLGVKPSEMFGVNDLYDQRDMNAVLNCLYALAMALEYTSWYKGPLLAKAGTEQTYERRDEPIKKKRESIFDIDDQHVDLDQEDPIISSKNFSTILAPAVSSPSKLSVYLLIFIFLAFLSGFGDVAGSSPLWQPLVHWRFDNCTNSTMSASPYHFGMNITNNTCTPKQYASIPVAIGFICFAFIGLFLDYLGPKIIVTIGLVLKAAGAFSLAFLANSELNYTIAWSLFTGGNVALLGLVPLAQCFKNKLLVISFLVSAYMVGAVGPPLAFFWTITLKGLVYEDRLWIVWVVVGSVTFAGAILGFLIVPMKLWEGRRELEYEEIKEEPEGLLKDTPPAPHTLFLNNLSIRYFAIALFGVVHLVKLSWQWEQLLFLTKNNNMENIEYFYLIPLFALFVVVPLCFVTHHCGQLEVLLASSIIFSVASSITVIWNTPSDIIIFVEMAGLSLAYPLTLACLIYSLFRISLNSLGISMLPITLLAGVIYIAPLYFLTEEHGRILAVVLVGLALLSLASPALLWWKK